MAIDKSEYDQYLDDHSGYARIKNEIVNGYQLESYEKSILIYLLSQRSDWRCSYSFMAKALCMSPRSVIRFTKSLEEKKILKIIKTAGEENDYKILSPAKWNLCHTVTSDSESVDLCHTVTGTYDCESHNTILTNKTYNNTGKARKKLARGAIETLAKNQEYLTDVSQVLQVRWIDRLTAPVVLSELDKAINWILANPKQQKMNYGRFFNNWLSKVEPPIQVNEDIDRKPRFS